LFGHPCSIIPPLPIILAPVIRDLPLPTDTAIAVTVPVLLLVPDRRGAPPLISLSVGATRRERAAAVVGSVTVVPSWWGMAVTTIIAVAVITSTRVSAVTAIADHEVSQAISNWRRTSLPVMPPCCRWRTLRPLDSDPASVYGAAMPVEVSVSVIEHIDCSHVIVRLLRIPFAAELDKGERC
jgi:hypothetical protein